MVITFMSTTPALIPGGLVAIISLHNTTLKWDAGVAPKSTAVTPVKFVPMIVTAVPPVAGPDEGLTRVTVAPTTVLACALVGMDWTLPALLVAML